MKKTLALIVVSLFIAFIAQAGPPPTPGGGNATQIQSRDVAETAPTDTYVLTWDAATSTWKPAAAPGAVTGAPTDAEYVTFQSNGTLSAERVLTEGTGIDLSTAVTGQLGIGVNTTEIGTTTWGAGGANYVWTFNTTGTDTAVTVSDSSFAVTSGTLKQGAVPVALGSTSPTDNTIPRWDGTGGQQLQNSSVVIDDSNNLSGIGTISTSGAINKVTITAPATGSTLTIAEGSSLVTAGAYSITLTSTGTTNVTLPTSGTLATTAATQPLDATLTALAGLATGDVSIIEMTGTDAFAKVTSGGNNYILGSNSDNSALEFKQPTGTGAPVLGTSPAFTTAITPNSAGASTIGTTSLEWGNVYLTDSAVIYGQADQSATLTSSASTWTASAFTVTGTLTANGNTVVGNADTDTLTLRSLIVGGNSRAVWIAGSAPTPTYATGTNELYVAGDIESGGTIYAANFQTTGTGESYLSMANNASRSPTASAYELYFEGGTDLKININGSEKTAARLEDAQTFTGAKTFSDTVTLNRGATGAGQLVIAEDSDDGSNTVTITAQAMSASYTLTLPTTDGDSGQFLQTNGSGSLTWAAPTAAAAGSDTQVQFNDGGSALGGDAGFVFAKTTGTLTLGKNTAGGELVLYNELGATDYSATIQPNAAQAAAATITLPAATGTLLSTAAAVTPAQGGTGVANGANNTITFTGNYTLGLTLTGNTAVTLPTSGTLATLGANTFTGTQALGTNNLTMTGSLAATGARVTKGWFTDIESTNMPTVGGTAILTSLTAPQFTTIELGHATDSTISRVSAGVLAIEGSNILTAGASPALTGAWDFGGATSVEIPNGTGPTVDAAGEIAVDTTSDQLVYYGGAKRVLPYKQYASFVIPAPADTDDINLLKAPYGMTISAINCIVQGTTSVTGQLQECSSTGGDCADLDSDITCDADGAADDGSLTDSAIAANGWLRWKTTSVSGTPTFLTVTVTYSVVSD